MKKLKTILAATAIAGVAMLGAQQAQAWGPFGGNGPWNGGGWGGGPWNNNSWGGMPWGNNRGGWGGPWNNNGWGGGQPWNNGGGWGGPWNNGGWGGNNGPWGGGPASWANPSDPKGSATRAWDDMLNTPNRMGRMPGGWRAPTVSVPNPVEVGDELSDAMRDMPNQMRNFSSN